MELFFQVSFRFYSSLTFFHSSLPPSLPHFLPFLSFLPPSFSPSLPPSEVYDPLCAAIAEVPMPCKSRQLRSCRCRQVRDRGPPCTALWCTVQHCTKSYCGILYSTVPHCAVLCGAVMYCSALSCIVIQCAGLTCSALHCTASAGGRIWRISCTYLWATSGLE